MCFFLLLKGYLVFSLSSLFTKEAFQFVKYVDSLQQKNTTLFCVELEFCGLSLSLFSYFWFSLDWWYDLKCDIICFFLFQKKIITSFFSFIKPLQSIFLLTQVLFFCVIRTIFWKMCIWFPILRPSFKPIYFLNFKKTCSSFHGSQHNLSLTRWKFL